MTVACLLVPFALQTEGVLRTVVDACQTEFAFAADLQAAWGQREIAARTYFRARGTLDASA